MNKKRLSLCCALPAALALLSSCAGIHPAAQAAFNSDFRQPIDKTLWEAEPKQAEQGLCGSDPSMLETTPDGLQLSLDKQNWVRNSCAYGGLWSVRTLRYGTVSATLKTPIHPGETTELLLLGDALAQDGPHKAIELRFLGKDLGGVQLRTLWDADKGEQSGGMTKWVSLGFDPGADFHVWGIRWEPGKVTWGVDGRDLFSTTLAVPSMPLTLVIRHWVPGSDDPNVSEDWGGPGTEDTIQYGSLDRTLWPSSALVRSVQFVPLQ